MNIRTAPALLLAGAFTLGFTHAALTEDVRSSQNVTVEMFEDGSGVKYLDGRKVRTFDAGTFPWNCETDGNCICGPHNVR